MTEARSFSDRLDRWLRDGPDAAPAGLLDDVLEMARELPSRRSGLGAPRPAVGWGPVSRSAAGLAAAAMVLIVLAVGAMLVGGTGPDATARPSDGASPSAAPAAVASPGDLRTLDPALPVGPTSSPSYDPCVAGTRLGGPGIPPAFDPGVVRGRIAYASGDSLVALDPANPSSRIAIHTTLRAQPTEWSSDGTRLLLYDFPDQDGASPTGAWVLNADGTSARLSRDPDLPAGVAFAPDGRTVVMSMPGGGLCLAGSDGSAPQLLAFDLAEPMDGPPAWSPDGGTIAWLDFVEDSPQYGHHAYGISFIDADGTNLRQLAFHIDLPDAGGGGLSYSPDGTRLMLWVATEIWLVDADGTDARRITTGFVDRSPAWSPDGSSIALVRDGRLYVMAADGSNPAPIGDVRPDGSIAWNRAP